MRCTLKTLDGDKIDIPECTPDMKILAVKEAATASEAGVKGRWPAAGLKLIYNGRVLANNKSLAHYGIDEKGFMVVLTPEADTSETTAAPDTTGAPDTSVEPESAATHFRLGAPVRMGGLQSKPHFNGTVGWIIGFEAIRLAGPVFYSAYSFIAVPLTIVVGMVVFAEHHSSWIWSALVLLLASLYLVNMTMGNARKRAEQR